MNDALTFLRNHGYTVLFLGVLLEQLGIPIPCTPWLLAAGALARAGELSLGLAIFLAALAAALGHGVWFTAGRRSGLAVLRLICKISIEPDACVQRTENAFTRWGSKSLVIAPFVPGLTTVAPPLAGMSGMSAAQYLLLDALGDTLWATTFVGTGFVFGTELGRLGRLVFSYAGSVAWVVIGALAVYLLWKLLQRARFTRKLRVARVTPEELHGLLGAGEPVLIVDLRNRHEMEAERATLPGALHISPDELELRHQEIARDRDVVLFCT